MRTIDSNQLRIKTGNSNNSALSSVIGSNSTSNVNYFKCDVCGKFINYSDFENGNVLTDHTPETPFECEKITHTHTYCL